MLKRFPLLLALAPALAVGGCMGTQNRGLETVHQPVVSRADYVLDLAAGPDGLARGEAQRLAGWAGALRLGYGDRVALDDPAGDPRARQAVAPSVAQPIASGTVRVVVSRMRAEVPGCPDWSRDASVEYDANTSSNHGCATNANLAAMIANPADLVHGQSGTGVNDPVASYRAIDAYRKANPTGGGGTTVRAESAGGK